jgi:GT2 family glycosyltransferase
MSADLTIVICTHNRVELLERTLASLNRARRPRGSHIEVLAIANACTDDTTGFLRRYQGEADARGWLPLRFAEEPRAGKSRALNLAIDLIRTAAVAYVDDDHRVDEGYLVGVCSSLEQHPDASLFCGRIIPDWDGSEPDWVHETGAYRIYPLPVPQFELGDKPMRVKPGEATPGGGNLCLRTELFARVGRYSVEFGPTGHDLAGGEDTEWVRRAIAQGAILQYVPEMLQYHYVDSERLTLSYVVRKSYQRSSSYVRLSPTVGFDGRVPAYMYRKLGTYMLSALASLGSSRRRFYLVRSAAALGEIRGVRSRRDGGLQSERTTNAQPREPGTYARAAWAAFGALAAIAVAAGTLMFEPLAQALQTSFRIGLAFTLLLLLKSLIDFTRTGPHITEEILSHYRLFLVQALSRLALATFVLMAGMAFLGTTAYVVGLVLFAAAYDSVNAAVAGVAGIIVLSGRAFCAHYSITRG